MVATRRSSRPARDSRASRPVSSRISRQRPHRAVGAPCYNEESDGNDLATDEDIFGSDSDDDIEFDTSSSRPQGTSRAQDQASSRRRAAERRDPHPPRIQNKNTSKRHSTQSRKQQKQQHKLAHRKRSVMRGTRGFASPSKRRKLASPEHFQEPQGIIPDWRDPRIPFDCWVDIFLYAAREGSSDILATSWLIHAATSCKAFAEPALSALYRCPQIRTTAKAKRLVSLLERPASETYVNYPIKIDALQLDIRIVPQPILFQLIHPLIRLGELIIFTSTDQPPYRELDRNVRWQYPEDVFRAFLPSSAISNNPIDTTAEKVLPTLLKSWEWSGKLLGGYVPTVADITRIHQTPSFSHLTRLSFTNFQVPSLRRLQIKDGDEEAELQAYREDGLTIEAIALAIGELKSLKHLVFESSTVMNDRLLPLLPKSLLHLELINCWEIKSEDLATFLHSHGHSLRTLSLLHNQSLDLAFLTDLAETCPNLRELYVNLSYFRHHDCVNDADPMYEQALLPSQVPRWPSSLRVISIEHIREWDVEAAEMFFQSLIDSALELSNLRHLVIKTMLDIPWQARASFRLQWRDKIEHVFLRKYTLPMVRTTLRQPDNTEHSVASQKRKKKELPVDSPSRRSGRIAAHDELSASERRRTRKNARHSQERPTYRDPDTDEDEFDVSAHSDEEDSAMAEAKSKLSDEQSTGSLPFVQGLCKTVSILFDNQKVRELQYGMEDFGSEFDEFDESEDEWNRDEDEDESVVIFR